MELFGITGNENMTREELALKSLDPQLGPKLSDIVPHGSQPEKVPLVRSTPSVYGGYANVLTQLTNYHRTLCPA